MKKLLFILFTLLVACSEKEQVEFDGNDKIVFQDLEVHAVCVEHWDLNGDLEISYKEASLALVTDEFANNERIRSFAEFVYFKRNPIIVKEAFKGCTNLASIGIGEHITSIEEAAFENCTTLAEICIPNSVNEVGCNCFKGCSSLKSVLLSNSLKSIRERTFMECISLASLELPLSLVSISSAAFYGCGLKSIVFNEAIENISFSAFYNCKDLSTVYCNSKRPPYIAYDAFEGCLLLEVIFVPLESVSAYRNDKENGWNLYSSYIMGYNEDENVIMLNNRELSVGYESSKICVSIKANNSYNIISKSEWIEEDIYISRSQIKTDSCYFNIHTNNLPKERIGQVVFQSKNGLLSDTLTITQNRAPLILDKGRFIKIHDNISEGIYIFISDIKANSEGIVNGRLLCPLPEGKNYGYMPYKNIILQGDTIEMCETVNSSFLEITKTGKSAGYTLKDYLGRYIAMKGDFNSFDVEKNETLGSYWDFISREDGTFLIRNLYNDKVVMYDIKYTSFGCYPSKTDSRLYLVAYKYFE